MTGVQTCALPILNKRPIPAGLRRVYAEQKVFAVENDTRRFLEQGIEVMERNLLLTKGEKVRHDSVQTAAVVLELALRGRQQRLNRYKD